MIPGGFPFAVNSYILLYILQKSANILVFYDDR